MSETAQALEIKKRLIQTDSQIGPVMMKTYEELAQREGIPIWGLTILGNRPYVNSVGLDCKLADLCKRNGWVKSQVSTELLEESRDTEDGTYRCGFKASVILFDNKGFKIALKELSQHPITKELLAEAADRFTYRFSAEGWAGHASVKMSTLKTPDFLRMMAATRALNRAKRAATGTGLTSVEEIGTEVVTPPAEPGAIERIPPQGGAVGEVVEGELLNTTSQPETTIRKVWLRWGLQDKEAYLTGFYQLFEKDLIKKTNAKFDKSHKQYTVPGPYVHEVYELARQHNVEIVEETQPKSREPGE